MLKQRLPGNAGVCGLEHAAIYGAEVGEIRFADDTGDSIHASAAEGADESPGQAVEELGGQRLGGASGSENEGEEDEEGIYSAHSYAGTLCREGFIVSPVFEEGHGMPPRCRIMQTTKTTKKDERERVPYSSYWLMATRLMATGMSWQSARYPTHRASSRPRRGPRNSATMSASFREMMIMRKTMLALVVAGAALALGACASQPKGKNQVAQQKKTHLVCFSTTKTGTHIAKTYCMTETNYAYYRKQQEKEREATQNSLQQMEQAGSHASQGDGGGG